MDVDEILAALRAVGEHLLPPGWLNDAVKEFLVGEDRHDAPVVELPGLRVQLASPQMLLALKVVAHRVNEDREDVRFLARLLGLATAAQVLDLVEGVVGPRLLAAQAQFFVEAVLGPEDAS